MLIPPQQGLDVGIRSQDCMLEYVICVYVTLCSNQLSICVFKLLGNLDFG